MQAIDSLVAGESQDLSSRAPSHDRRVTARSETLSIVIPAFNEEESIGTTIQRCLDARMHIQRVGRIHAVDIVVVSDGSTDRTAEIARSIAEREPSVSVIEFEKNRGYGAAIKEGFAKGTGGLLAFLDADGTCDPRTFAYLCRALQEEKAAVALGSRMGPGTQMPRLRRIGNTIYALMLGSLSGQAVSDIASGMRVIRREALADLYPLPNGMHFTPAMSARAIMSDLRTVELPMPYAERVGESKLNVLRDGVRFLLAISDATLLFQPGKVFRLGAVVSALTAVLWGLYPWEFYWRNHRLEEWMIYRLLLCGFLVSSAFTLICASVLSDQVLSLVYRRRRLSFVSHLFDRLLNRQRSWALAAVAACAGIALVWPGLVEYVCTGHVTIHWSRPVAAVFLMEVALVASVHAVLRKVINLWTDQLAHVSGVGREPNLTAVVTRGD